MKSTMEMTDFTLPFQSRYNYGADSWADQNASWRYAPPPPGGAYLTQAPLYNASLLLELTHMTRCLTRSTE